MTFKKKVQPVRPLVSGIAGERKEGLQEYTLEEVTSHDSVENRSASADFLLF